MASDIGAGVLAIVTGIIGLAIISVILSKNAQTSTVLNASGSALASVIGAAVAPVSGGGAGSGGFSPSILSSFGSGLAGSLL